MKKLFYYLLFPSILFSQTTPSVTPRVDGEGSLGTETYRWGEGHFDELYSTAPSLADDSNRVPTTSWVNNLIQSDGSLVDYVYKNTSFTAEPNKKYSIDTSLGDITVTLPELTEEMIASSINIRHSAGSNNIIVNRSGTNTIAEASSYTSYSFKGLGSYLDIAAYTESVWLIIRSSRVAEPSISSDTNVAATTAWVRDVVGNNYLKNQGAVTLEGSLTLEGSVSTETSNGMTFLSATNNTTFDKIYNMYGYMGGEVDTFYLDYSDSSSLTKLFSYAGLNTANKYGEFFIPLKIPNPTAADDSTNVATTAWVQDEIATKAPLASPALTGTPTAPTAAKGTNTTQIATTGYVYGNYKQICSYTQGGSTTVDPAEPCKLYSFTGAGTLVLPVASTVPDGSIIDVFCQSNVETVTITSETRLIGVAGSSSYTFSLSGYGNTVRFQSISAGSSYYWMILFDPERAIAIKAAGALLTEATPASSSATGTKGMIRYDADYVYICTATDTWIRIAKDTW